MLYTVGTEEDRLMLLKGCMHTHTTCSDGKMSPQQVADVYSGLGYDFIAFTDHDYLARPAHEEIYDSVETDLLVFKGVELTVFEKGYLHVARISGDEEELHVLCHVGEYDLSLEQVLDRIERIAASFPLDAVEVTSKGFLDRDLDVPELGYPRMASDDSHTRAGCGRAWIELDCRRDRDSIIRAIRKGRFWNCYARGSIGRPA